MQLSAILGSKELNYKKIKIWGSNWKF
jgi:hypothetical protein